MLLIAHREGCLPQTMINESPTVLFTRYRDNQVSASSCPIPLSDNPYPKRAYHSQNEVGKRTPRDAPETMPINGAIWTYLYPSNSGWGLGPAEENATWI